MADPTRHPAWPAWRNALLAVAADVTALGGDGPDAALTAVLRRATSALDVDPTPFWQPSSTPAGDQDGQNAGGAVEVPAWPEGLDAPDVLGAAHEALLAADRRRALGVHLTPPSLASALVGWAVEGWTARPSGGGALRVHDPAVGAGAFLLAAARQQVSAGADPETVLGSLSGTDLDPLAVEVARAAVGVWAVEHGVDPAAAVELPRARIVVGDGLLDGPPGEAPDLVAGNPPFLGQLRRATARGGRDADALRDRFGDAAIGYVDSAALFLLAGVRSVRPGGRVVLVQPESVLGARDAERLRAALVDAADLVGLWVADEVVFEASVDVCAVLLERRRPAGASPRRLGTTTTTTVVAAGTVVREVATEVTPRPASWAPLLASARGVPAIALDRSSGEVGDLATATAGFRQHFYAAARHLVEAPAGAGDGLDPRAVALVTTGLIHPLRVMWGERAARVDGRTWQRPAVDLAALDADDAAVARWFRDRLRPKVLVAPQTRVVEAAVDPLGCLLPGVPVVSVEPRDDATASAAEADPDLAPWLVAAALSAPPVTAWALREAAGTARSRDAVKLAARQVLRTPLPVDRAGWEEAARALRDGVPLVDVAPTLTAAHGVDPDDPVVAWWRARLPR